MKLKLWILVLVGICFLLLLANQSQAISYTELKKQLGYRLAQSSPDFEDADLQACIIMGRIAVLNHGLSGTYEIGSRKVVFPNQQFVPLYDVAGGSLDIMFVTSVILTSGGKHRSLLEHSLKDLAHRHLDTDVPLSYYSFFRHKDSTFISVYPTSANTETLYVTMVKCGFATTNIITSPIFEEVWLDYALFIAYLRIENYQAAAQAYNSYAKGIAILREQLFNVQPDVTIAPKIIK